MPSRKQRRRREKGRRHEYEYVYVDDEGHELDASEVEEVEEEKPSPAKSTRGGTASATKPKSKATGAKKGSAKAAAAAKANIRLVAPPSWRRVLKRGVIFAPFMLLAIVLLGRGLSWPARILETLWLLVLFVPFSYMIDRMMYRRYLRQIGEEPPARQRRA